MRPFRRRKEKKTDYKARLAMLKSSMPRLVVRRYNRNIRIQIIDYDPVGDKTLIEVNSSKIEGLKCHPGNISSAYLAGYYAGMLALKKNLSPAILDIGLQTSTKGSSIFAAAKGAADAGLEIAIGEGIVPNEDRIKGSHINQDAVKNFEESFAKIKNMKL